MSKKTKLVIKTESQFKASLAQVKAAIKKYDASNSALVIEWHETTLPIINALVRCIASNRKEINKTDDYSLALSASIASSAMPKVNVNYKVLKKSQVQHAKRVKTLIALSENGIGAYLNG